MKNARLGRVLTVIAIAMVLVGPAIAQNNPITITAYVSGGSSVQPADDNKIYKLIQDKLGVTFKWDIVVGNSTQKTGVLIASQDYPDIMSGDTRLIDAEAYIPLEDLIQKYAPNLKKHYSDDPSVWEKMKAKDGHIYILPNFGVIHNGPSDTAYWGAAMWIQKAVMKEAGYPKIKTIDEYFKLIADYKAKHPTTEDGKPTIGFSILTYDWHAFTLINPPQFLAGYPNDGNGVVDPKTGKYSVHLGLDIAKRWYKLLNAINAKGLLDRDSFIDNYDQYLSKLANGQILGVHDQLWQFNDSQTPLQAQKKILQTMMPLPIVFDSSIVPHYRDRPLPNINNGWGISVKAKDPVRIIKFFDAQMTEEWQKTLAWGIKGEDYLLDPKGQPYRTPEMRKAQLDPNWAQKNQAAIWNANAPKLEGHFSDGSATGIANNSIEYQSTLDPTDQAILKTYGVASWSELMDKSPPPNPSWYPGWQLTPPDGSPAQFAWKKANDTAQKFLPKVILAKPKDFDKRWKEYLDALAKTNVQAYQDFMQSGIDERIAKFGKKK